MVVSRSPDNELTAIAALLVPHCSLASGSIAELLAELPTGLEQVLVICDDALLDSGAIELMCSVAAAAGAVLSAQRFGANLTRHAKRGWRIPTALETITPLH